MTTATNRAPKIHRGPITVTTGEGPVEIPDAHILGGLAAHPDVLLSLSKGYVVTHIASGMKFAHFSGPLAARRALVKLAGFTDWTLPKERILETVRGAEYGRLRNLIRECNGF